MKFLAFFAAAAFAELPHQSSILPIIKKPIANKISFFFGGASPPTNVIIPVL
jgi:hypothetical protein